MFAVICIKNLYGFTHGTILFQQETHSVAPNHYIAFKETVFVSKYAKLNLLFLTSFWLAGCDGPGAVVTEALIDEVDRDTVVSFETIDEIETGFDETPNTITLGDSEAEPGDLALAAALPAAGQSSHIDGAWSSSYTWPVSPIHAAVLPTGSILSYGTGTDTSDPAQRLRAFEFDSWSPKLGLGASAHELTPTGINTNVFCSAQVVMTDGNVLITGGDKQPQGPTNTDIRFDGIRAATLYDTGNHMVSKLPRMSRRRWYPTIVTLESGAQLVLGGRAENQTEDGSSIVPNLPEVYSPFLGTWKQLRGARSGDYYRSSWFYPRAFLTTHGVIVLSHGSSTIYRLTTSNQGSFTDIGKSPASFGSTAPALPIAMYRPDKVLAMGRNGLIHTFDFVQSEPVVKAVNQPSGIRFWGNMTVMADGKVLLVGGSRERQELDTAVHFGEIWDPETDTWQTTASSIAQHARLYHSVSLLLPDASVMVGGGGPPGPVINQNAEIYYPPYLFKKDGSGELANRPVIENIGTLAYGETINVVMKNSVPVSRVTLVRAGSTTHSFDSSQRFMDLDFTQSAAVLDVSVPQERHKAPPGLYMVFVFDEHGVPSEAHLQILK